jgi:hypothetical protein
MLKRNEALDPNSCWNKAREDEMVFVLLGRDAAAADTIRFWAKRRIQLGKNKATDSQILEAFHTADEIERGLVKDSDVQYRPAKISSHRADSADEGIFTD